MDHSQPHPPSSSPSSGLARALVLVGAAAVSVLGCDRRPPQAPPVARVPVTMEVVEATAFRPVVRLLGRVEPAARIVLRPEAAGTVAYPPRFAGGLRTGERVARGEIVFRVESPEIALAAVEAELGSAAAEAEVERSRQGVEGGFVSLADHKRNQIQAHLAAERLESARAAVARLVVHAPSAGDLRVAATVPPGTRVEPATVLAELAAEGDLRVEAWAAASDLAELATGLEAEMLSPRDGRTLGRGRVIELARDVDDGGVARVVVGLEEDLGMARVGDGVELEVSLPERSDVVTVPERALLTQGGVSTVYTLEASGADFRAASRLVLPGGRRDGRVEILEGLEAGERIAVEGAELLADGLVAIDAGRERKPWE